MFFHFGCNLTICHFVSRLQFHREATKFLGLNVLAELAFRFTWAKDQNCTCSTQTSDYLIKIFIAVAHVLSLKSILRNEVILRIPVLRA